MAASVGHPADSGSLLASRGSELSAVRQRRAATDSGAGDMPKNPSPHWSTNQIALLQRWLDKGSATEPRAPASVHVFTSSGLRFSRHLAVSTATR
jgi:hypothetical protein